MLCSEVVARALKQGVLLTTAESCTGGLVAGALTDIAGSSGCFERGFITYSNAAKIEMLGVCAETLDEFGAVSEQIAAQMALGASLKAQADLAVSVTGIAGPGGSEHKPEGRVCFGVARGNVVHTETIEFGALGRAIVRQRSVEYALNLLNQSLISG